MRPLTKLLLAIMTFILLCVGHPVRTLIDHADIFTKDGLLTAQAEDLKATTVTAHLEVPLRPEKNILWCGSFQLAWNEACSLIKEDLQFAPPVPLAAALNKHAMTGADLDQDSYVALAGFMGDGIQEQIRGELKKTFHGRATPHFLPPAGLTPRLQDLVAYAYLFKNLEFPTPFERLDDPIEFGKVKVAGFGMGEYKPEHFKMYPQVLILDYKSSEDFVIELKTKSPGDRLILALMAPGETLAATVKNVMRRAEASTGTQAQGGDILKIPKLNFDITHVYQELLGQSLVTRNPAVAKDLRIVGALQNTRFQLDEKGVRLHSESEISMSCAMEGMPPQHIMILDHPFLILMKRAGAKAPYFALWVGNPELLVKS